MSVWHYIVVIGTSAGGLEALDRLFTQIPIDGQASFLVVQHMSPEGTAEVLMERLRKSAPEVKLAEDGEEFRPSVVYVARPDYHLLIKENQLMVTKGARENRFRPAIDPLFRSAAVNHGSRVIGVVLTGMLNDGAAGLAAIQRCGGSAVVQDPADAAYPDMPQAALNAITVDHCLPLSQMGGLLSTLIGTQPPCSKAVPDDIRTEAEIAERVLSDVAQVSTLGSQVPYNCPNCGGVLWDVSGPKSKRYRCHTGHSFTATTLLVSQTEKIEETLWSSLRMFEERKNLLHKLASESTNTQIKKGYAERASETKVHIERIRTMLRAPSVEPIE